MQNSNFQREYNELDNKNNNLKNNKEEKILNLKDAILIKALKEESILNVNDFNISAP